MSVIEKKTGIGYCRVSSKEQVEGTSLEMQEKNIREYTARNGIELLKVFVDRGESAKTANRPEFLKAIAFCSDKRHPVDYFIVYKIDRFSRKQYDHATVRAILNKHGTELCSTTEPIDSTPVGAAMEGMLSVFAEFDNNVRTERSKSGMLENVRKGIWQWREPPGYYRPLRGAKGSNIAPIEATKHLYRLIFDEWREGTHSYESLAEYMAERGLRTTTGKKPRKQFIQRVLENPLYCGIIEAFGERNNGTFESLVTPEVFEECRLVREGGARPLVRNVANPDFPLRRFVHCPVCKRALTGSTSTGRKGKRYAYYHHHIQGCTEAKFIAQKEFEDQFAKYLTEISPSARFEKLFRAVVLDVWKTNYKQFNEVSERTRREIGELEQERLKVFDLHRAGKYTDDEFTEQKAIINERIAEKHRLLRENHIEEFNMEAALDYCFQFVRNSSETWRRLKYPLKVRFQNLVFPQKVTFADGKFGTAELSLVFSLNRDFDGETSHFVRPPGLEPGTLCFEGKCSIQLSYGRFSSILSCSRE